MKLNLFFRDFHFSTVDSIGDITGMSAINGASNRLFEYLSELEISHHRGYFKSSTLMVLTMHVPRISLTVPTKNRD